MFFIRHESTAVTVLRSEHSVDSLRVRRLIIANKVQYQGASIDSGQNRQRCNLMLVVAVRIPE
jgi:hypothetical protein